EGLQLSSVGSNVFEFTSNATTTGNLLFMNAVTETDFEITNLSIKDADTDWTKGTGWIVHSGVASCDGTQVSNSEIEQADVMVVGTSCLIKATITRSAGGISFRAGSATSSLMESSGTYSFVVPIASTGTLKMRAQSDFVGTVDNISVHALTFQKEIADSVNYTGDHYVLPIDENDFAIAQDYTSEAIVSQVFGGETLATVGFTVANNAVLSAVDTPVNVGEFAIKIDSNGTPTADADCDIDFTVDNTSVYRLSLDWRHTGTGLDWMLQVEGVTAATRAVGNVTYATKIYYFTTADTTTTVRFKENNESNNGGVYFDNLKLQKVTFP
ncbi:hypothetical protein LCGC14_1789870, partial [marine sediment metagenome]